MNQISSRRKFIQSSLFASGTFLGAGLLLGGCNSQTGSIEKKEKNFPKEESKTTGAVEQDLSRLSESELQKRQKLGYVEKSPIPDSYCSNCALYLPPAAGQEFGGCQLFKGPVNSTAYCTYWVAPQK